MDDHAVDLCVLNVSRPPTQPKWSIYINSDKK
jgi:hypothetical protein